MSRGIRVGIVDCGSLVSERMSVCWFARKVCDDGATSV